MEQLTITVAILASVLVFFLKPTYALIVYVICFVYYPTYLTIPLGTIDFTVRRIVIIALFAKVLMEPNLLGRFRWLWPDKAVLIYFAIQVLAGAMNGTPFGLLLENRAGASFDMVLPYFATRMIINDKRQYLTFLKGLLLLAAPMAILGLYQCMTGHNIASFFGKYYAWGQSKEFAPISRFGFFRANITFSHSIMFGLFFAMFGPVCAGLLKQNDKYRKCYIFGLLLMAAGVFASMSSGPMLAALLSIVFIVSYRFQKYWKQILVAIIAMCVLVDIASNRHFYHVACRFTLSGDTAWYRTRLIEVALFEGGMSGHWLTGFPYGVDPGWGPRIDGRSFVDIVNEYIAVLSGFGLAGLIAFLAVVAAAIKKLTEAFRASMSDSDRWLVWCLSGALFGILVSLNSVSLFDQPTTIFYIILGLCVAAAEMAKNRRLGVVSRTQISAHPRNEHTL